MERTTDLPARPLAPLAPGLAGWGRTWGLLREITGEPVEVGCSCAESGECWQYMGTWEPRGPDDRPGRPTHQFRHRMIPAGMGDRIYRGAGSWERVQWFKLIPYPEGGYRGYVDIPVEATDWQGVN